MQPSGGSSQAQLQAGRETGTVCSSGQAARQPGSFAMCAAPCLCWHHPFGRLLGEGSPLQAGSLALSRSRPRHLLLMGRWPETERGGRAPGVWVLPRRGWMGCTPCRLGYGECPVSFDVEAVCTKGKYCEVSKACQSSPGDMYSTRDGVSLYSGEENRSVRGFGGVWRSLEENLVRAYVFRQKSRLLRELQ